MINEKSVSQGDASGLMSRQAGAALVLMLVWTLQSSAYTQLFISGAAQITRGLTLSDYLMYILVLVQTDSAWEFIGYSEFICNCPN